MIVPYNEPVYAGDAPDLGDVLSFWHSLKNDRTDKNLLDHGFVSKFSINDGDKR